MSCEFLNMLLNMTKKEYILAVLNALPEREMWWWIKAMVQNDQLDEHTINILVIILKKAMDKITATIKENKMIEAIKSINNFDKKEEKQAKEDAKTLEELDLRLDNI